MIRWRFVITRLIVVIAVIVLLHWGLGPVAKYITVRALESVTGAKVDIASTGVGLFPPSLRYQGVAVADPRSDKEYRDAFRADVMEFAIDGDALLHRRWVASNGRITGIEVGSMRDDSGHYADVIEAEPASASDSPSMLSRLLGAATDEVGEQADALVAGSETVRQGKEIRARWESEYESLVVRARGLEKKIRTVRDEARGIENPLRDWRALERTLARAREARNELMTVRQAIDSLPDRLQSDLAQLDAAKQADLAEVDKYVPGDLSESDDFGIDILTSAVREQIQTVRGYLEGGRAVADYTIIKPESDRVRGVDHDLDPANQVGVLVRRCEVGGVMRSGGDTYAMTGILENLTPTPERLVDPTRARLRLEGPEVLRVEYIRDRRLGNDVDLLTLHWPQTDAKPILLGNEHDAGISIEGGQRELWVQLRSEGDQLKGRLVSKQTGLAVTLNVKESYAETTIAKSLASSLDAIDRIEVDASFSGDWNDMDLKLATNLEPILKRATQDAVNEQIAATRAKLADKVQQLHLQQSMELRQWLASQQSEARSLLASADRSIEEMNEKVLSEVGDADAYLGKLRSAIRGPLR